MSQSVEIDASKNVDQGVEISADTAPTTPPSDVYLALFWRRATRDMISFEEFGGLAETWIRIRYLEGIEANLDELKEQVEKITEILMTVPDKDDEDPELDYKALYEDLVDSLLEPEAPDEPGEVQIDQHTFVSEADAEAEIAAMKEAPESPSDEPKPGSWAKFRTDRKFKQAVTERIREARKMGIGSETIAQNTKGQGVTGDTIRQILNAQPVDVRKYRKIDEAMDRLGVPKQEEDNEQEG